MTCTVCSHPDREAIDGALVTAESKRGIARRFGCGSEAIRRHASHHLAPELRKRADLTEVSRLDGYIAGLVGLERQAERRGKNAEEKGDIRTALVAQHEQRETLLARAKLLGVGARETIDLQVSEVHHFEPPPEYLARVVQNLRELRLLPEPETRIMLDMSAAEPSLPETNGHADVNPGPTSDDLVEESDIDEYDGASGEVRSHHTTPPPSGLGVIKLPGHDGSSGRGRWDWER